MSRDGPRRVGRINVPAIIFGGLAGISAIATVYFTVETVLLLSGQQPITWYVRNLTSWHPGVAILVVALIAFGVGAGITHFAWDVGRHALVARLRRQGDA